MSSIFPKLSICRAASVVIGVALLAVSLQQPARAGEITVKGEELQGKVVGVTSSGLEFETVYGEGRITIPFANIEAIESDQRFVILYGESGETQGRILGVSETQIFVGDDPASAIAIDPSSIFRSFTEQEFTDSTYDRLHSRYRYWKGNFDFGFAATQATTDTGAAAFALEVERKKNPTRLLLVSGYRYSIEQKQGEPESVIENEITGLLRGEYDLTKRLFAFASVTGEYDQVESLSLRSVPKAGLGYKIWEGEKGFLSADVGMSYVYQRFFGGDTESYTAVAFGTEAKYELPYGAIFSARGEYLPSVTEPTDNYLLRGSSSLAVPMLSWVALKLTVFDEYNNRPAPDTEPNKFTVTAGLSMLF